MFFSPIRSFDHLVKGLPEILADDSHALDKGMSTLIVFGNKTAVYILINYYNLPDITGTTLLILSSLTLFNC